MSLSNQHQSSNSLILAKSLINAGKELGLTQADLESVIGKSRASFQHGINPKSKDGELALILIRCYQSLFSQMGGNDKI